jgi:hypothetical protein
MPSQLKDRSVSVGRREILIEGLRPEELLNLTELEGLVVTGEPVIFRAGSADVLAEFSIQDQTLKVELAVMENGGDGVLPAIISLIERAAVRRGLFAIEWWIYARNCTVPNPKLERVLSRLGFQIRENRAGSEFYWIRKSTNGSLRRG